MRSNVFRGIVRRLWNGVKSADLPLDAFRPRATLLAGIFRSDRRRTVFVVRAKPDAGRLVGGTSSVCEYDS